MDYIRSLYVVNLNFVPKNKSKKYVITTEPGSSHIIIKYLAQDEMHIGKQYTNAPSNNNYITCIQNGLKCEFCF